MSLGKCAENPKEGMLRPSLNALVESRMEDGVVGMKQYGNRPPAPGTTERRGRELPGVEKEWQEMKSVG